MGRENVKKNPAGCLAASHLEGSGGMVPQKINLDVWDHIWLLLRPIVNTELKAIKIFMTMVYIVWAKI